MPFCPLNPLYPYILYPYTHYTHYIHYARWLACCWLAGWPAGPFGPRPIWAQAHSGPGPYGPRPIWAKSRVCLFGPTSHFSGRISYFSGRMSYFSGRMSYFSGRMSYSEVGSPAAGSPARPFGPRPIWAQAHLGPVACVPIWAHVPFFRSNILFFRSNVLFFRSNVLFFRSNVLFLRSNVLFLRSNVLFFRSNVLFFRSNVLFFRSNVLFFRSNVLFGSWLACCWLAGSPIWAQAHMGPGPFGPMSHVPCRMSIFCLGKPRSSSVRPLATTMPHHRRVSQLWVRSCVFQFRVGQLWVRSVVHVFSSSPIPPSNKASPTPPSNIVLGKPRNSAVRPHSNCSLNHISATSST
jgi:hypothetical protein